MIYIYKTKFIGKDRLEIGIVYPIEHVVESSTELDENSLRLKLYENYDHISMIEVAQVKQVHLQLV